MLYPRLDYGPFVEEPVSRSIYSPPTIVPPSLHSTSGFKLNAAAHGLCQLMREIQLTERQPQGQADGGRHGCGISDMYFANYVT